MNEGIGNKINIARAKSHFNKGEKIAAINKKTKKVTKITGANQFGSFNPKEYDFAYINKNQMTEKINAEERINAELERISNTEQKVHHSQIYIPCSLDLDYEMQYQSE